jgi:hypothetical protein
MKIIMEDRVNKIKATEKGPKAINALNLVLFEAVEITEEDLGEEVMRLDKSWSKMRDEGGERPNWRSHMAKGIIKYLEGKK